MGGEIEIPMIETMHIKMHPIVVRGQHLDISVGEVCPSALLVLDFNLGVGWLRSIL